MSRTHRVAPGETLSGIAHRYGLPWAALAHANAITNPAHLKIGVLLHIPAPGPHAAHAGHAPQPLPPTSDLPSPTSDPPPTSSAADARLGDLSMLYETGFRPGRETEAAAVVSSGTGDPGGISYGAYQLASSTRGGRQVQTFLQRNGLAWASQFTDLDPTVAGGFGATWKAIAASQAQAFFAAQHAYIECSHYAPVVNYVKAATAVDIGARSRSLRNVVWSMAVQHGKAKTLVATAIVDAGPQGARSDVEYDRDVIGKLYDEREAYVDALGLSYLKSRYAAERRDALQQLGSR